MKRLTPQEKKALSYAKDRRNCYGESVKGARKSIRLNKVKPSRAYRRNVNQLLQSEAIGAELETTDILDHKVRSLMRRQWHKYPDMPLGEFVKLKLEYRLNSHRARIKRNVSREKLNNNAGDS